MFPRDVWTIVGVGVLFIVLGFAALGWARAESKSYDLALARRKDIREYLTHWPLRPEAGGLRVGGVILLIVGIALTALGLFLRSRVS